MAAVGDPRGYYQALGVDRTASAEDIRTAFRLRAKELHPDRAGETGDREAFRQLREAYEALRDPQQRLRYDTESLAGDRGRTAAAETGSPGADAVWRLVERLAPGAGWVSLRPRVYDTLAVVHRSSAALSPAAKLLIELATKRPSK